MREYTREIRLNMQPLLRDELLGVLNLSLRKNTFIFEFQIVSLQKRTEFFPQSSLH